LADRREVHDDLDDDCGPSSRSVSPGRDEAAAPVEKRRARKLIFLPITSRVPVYCQIGKNVEGTTALEF